MSAFSPAETTSDTAKWQLNKLACMVHSQISLVPFPWQLHTGAKWCHSQSWREETGDSCKLPYQADI